MSEPRIDDGGEFEFPRALIGAVAAFVAAYGVFLVALMLAAGSLIVAIPELWQALFGDWCERRSGELIGGAGCPGPGPGGRLSGLWGEVVEACLAPWRASRWPWLIAAVAAAHGAALSLALFARDARRSRH